MAIKKVNYYVQLELIPEEVRVEEVNEYKWSVRKRRQIESRMAFSAMEEAPSWLEEYLHLTAGGWPWRIAAFIAWSATPRRLRWPTTLQELAVKVLGLRSRSQIAKWKRKMPVIKDVIAALQITPMLEYRADVIQALIESAIVPDPRNAIDRKIFLEMTEDYVPGGKLLREFQKSVGLGVKNKSDAELEKYLPGLEEQFQDYDFDEDDEDA